MNNNHFQMSCLAMVLGTGIGMLLAAGGQKFINRYQLKHCPQKPGHQLVMLTSFVGDAYYCLDKRTL